ncbi:hypothetical protein BKK47_07205 [Rodentibacter mrazii]|uniref:Uncharacterized protein n=1 Tax=Rodentibacter mrazii TaxID=1908257 RepID=A0A1V3IFM9_9PAST|nr:hypothetical protein [Rodentibacter mrazii]OOF39152.1 hypothetical protein BKK47_07205 [Rodentibacter mrazii]
MQKIEMQFKVLVDGKEIISQLTSKEKDTSKANVISINKREIEFAIEVINKMKAFYTYDDVYDSLNLTE